MASSAQPVEASSLGRLRRRLLTEAESLERAMEDFEDPSQEWRRLFSELLGTFFLVLVGRGRRNDGAGIPAHD